MPDTEAGSEVNGEGTSSGAELARELEAMRQPEAAGPITVDQLAATMQHNADQITREKLFPRMDAATRGHSYTGEDFRSAKGALADVEAGLARLATGETGDKADSADEVARRLVAAV